MMLKPKKGQLLIEVLIGLGFAIFAISSIGYFVMEAANSSRQGIERTKATFLAREGLEAARSIRDADFDNLIDGTHGIRVLNNEWIFSGTFDTINQFKRQIIISNIEQGIKKIESRVIWKFSKARENSVVLISYLTDWNQTQGEAGELYVDIDNVSLGIDNTEIEGINIGNQGETDIVIDKMSVHWIGGAENNELLQVVINGNLVWSGNASSSEELDISDFTLNSGVGSYPITSLDFKGDISGATLLIRFIMRDGNIKSVSYIQV